MSNTTKTATNSRIKDATISPLTYRKLRAFQSNRRGYWSLWIFLFILVLSLFSELICNDRPLQKTTPKPTLAAHLSQRPTIGTPMSGN